MKNCEVCGKEYDESRPLCPSCGTENAQYIPNNAPSSAAEMAVTNEPLSDTAQPAEEPAMTKEDMLAALAAAKAAGAADLQQNTAQVQEQAEELPKSKLKTAIITTIIIGLIVIAGAVAALWYINQNADKDAIKPVEHYMEGYVTKNVDNILNSYPAFMKNAIVSNASPDEVWESLQANFATAYGEDWKATYEIGETEEILADELTSLQSYLNQYYSTEVTLKKGYWVNTDLTLGGSKDSQTLSLRLAVVQIDGKWSIVYEATADSQNTGSSEAVVE